MAIDIEQLYRAYAPMVLRRCRQLLRDEERAVDAMQDAFVQLLRRRSTLVASGPSSMLYRVATNTCLNALRSERRRPAISLQPEERRSDDDPAARILDRLLLDEVFRQERESTRLMAVLHWVDRFTLEQVADEVGLSVSGVRKRLRSLRQRAAVARELGHV